MELSFGIRSTLATPRDAEVIVCLSPALFSACAAVLRERLRRRDRRRPVVVWVQDLYARGLAQLAGRETFSSWMMARLEGWVFRSAAAVAVLHERIADHLVTDLGVAPDLVRVVRNWVRESWPQVRRDGALADLGWSDMTGSTIVVHAGSLGAKQQLENVVRAGLLAEEEDAKVVFVFVGDGACRRDLEMLAGGVRSVRFVGVLDHEAFGQALSAADVLLVNQSPEVADMCVPSKLVTYYAAERPIVAAVSRQSIVADELLGLGTGVVVAPGEPAALLQAVQRLGRDPARARSLGEAGGAVARSSFDRDRILGQFSAWLADLLPAERARSSGRHG
jgi:glycosyltransferase involved in cell wall biosynthesis